MCRPLFVLILYFEGIVSLKTNDCGVLSLVCKRDPGCGDDKVFFAKCVQSLASDQASRSDAIDHSVRWDPRSSTRSLDTDEISYNHLKDAADSVKSNEHLREQKIQNLKNVYAAYQRESIRESLYLIKKKLQSKRDVERNQNSGSNSFLTGENLLLRRSDSNNEDLFSQSPPLNRDVIGNADSSDRGVSHERYTVDDKQSVIDKAFKLVRSLISRRNNEYGISYGPVIDKSSVKIKRKIEPYKPPLNDLSHIGMKLSVSSEVAENRAKVKDEGLLPVFNDSATHKHSDDNEINTPLDSPSYSENSKNVILPGKNSQLLDESDKQLSVTSDVSSHSDENLDRVEIAVPIYIKNDNDINEETRKDLEDIKTKKVSDEEDRGYLVLNTSNSLTEEKATAVGKALQDLLWKIEDDKKIFQLKDIHDTSASYHMVANPSWFKYDDNAGSVAHRINKDETLRSKLSDDTGVTVLSAVDSLPVANSHPRTKVVNKNWNKISLFSAVIVTALLGILFATAIVFFVKRRGKNNLTPLIFRRQEAVQDYQELCRTQMSVVNSPRGEDDKEKNGDMKTWNDGPSPYNMDITTGHVILAYMEDHLKNENRLNKEWEALCSYKADDSATIAGSDIKNQSKNRYRDVLPYDHNRVKLHESSNLFHSDYINASFITDTDPRNPTYIATQGPLDNTVNDFWQMVWEQGVVVIINLTKLSDMGLPQCHHYWPEDGSAVYHIYEVQLISEHIWCDDYLVRSLYLRNLQTAETRTVTQFHYLTWPDLNIPSSPKPLLEFRRKVNKCYRGHACPVVVHCNNGVGRTGTYILLDMVLNKMIKGTKEIDIAATLEHLRDQRQDCVKTKGQFEFALLAVAEDVTAILSAVSR